MEIVLGKDTPKYLFEAKYKDGIVYTQRANDSSLFVDGKNAFFDIFYQPWKPLSELVTFTLKGEGNEYMVNLVDGRFTVNGAPMQVNDDLPVPAEFRVMRRLIYFKRHRHHFNSGDMKQTGHEIAFMLGWQATIPVPDGKGGLVDSNVQQVIYIS